ncbi:hypothetical protein KJ877_06685 [bacterium]|nr:hypothetical protein [bacterium]MBU1991328.1 hypothetical protein [bacterium]
MFKIKIAGILIFSLSVVLSALSLYINHVNIANANMLSSLNAKKELSQEVSKNIFYIYKNKHASTKQLEYSIEQFIANINKQEKEFKEFAKTDSSLIKTQNDTMINLWNEFSHHVQKFTDQNKVNTAYTNIILEQTIKDVYNTNLQLVMEIEKSISMYQAYFFNSLETYKTVQIILFLLLVLLLIYLFLQMKDLMIFIQKFLDASKKLIANATIKELKPVKLNNTNKEIVEAGNNFNFFINKINDSVRHSSHSLNLATHSLESVEKNIEDFIDLLYIAQENKQRDKDLTKKEDAVIQSLEEVSISIQRLKELKQDLDNLTSSITIKKS